VRTVSAETTAAWKAAAKMGVIRPMVRATIEKLNIGLVPYDMSTLRAVGSGASTVALPREESGVFASAQFCWADTPKELPNIKSVRWSRSIDSDAASCDIQLYNTDPLPLGQTPPDDYEFDVLGAYTPNRGKTAAAQSRWGQTANQWQELLVPDRIIRTYEGYGFDPTQAPGNDPNLYSSGVWLIDEVTFSADGMIQVTARDLSRLLMDHIAFPPVVPWEAYPLSFSWFHQVANTPGTFPIGGWARPSYSTDSTQFYARAGYSGCSGGSVNGHNGRHAFDGSNDTYWMTLNNAITHGHGWVQGSFASRTVGAVQVNPWNGPYSVFISLQSAGAWIGIPRIHAHPGDLDTGESIPIVYHGEIPKGQVTTIKLAKTYTNVTAIRVTLIHNGTYGGDGQHVGCRDVLVCNGLTVIPSGSTHTEGDLGDWCADTETEVLTRRGWLHWDEVQAGDEAFTINPTTGLGEWDLVVDVFRKHRIRKMIRMEGVSHSSLTTPDHRWITQDAGSGKFRFRTTENLNTNDRIPICAPRGDAPCERKYSDDIVELVAWWWTEGSRRKGGGGEIGQSERVNANLVQRIRELLTRLYGEPGFIGGHANAHPSMVSLAKELHDEGLTYREIARVVGVSGYRVIKAWDEKGWTPWALWNERTENHPSGHSRMDTPLQMVKFRISETVVRELVDLAPDRLPTMDFLCALTIDQLNLFIDISVAADGNTKSGGYRFFNQTGEHRMKVFEAACALAGVGTSVHPRTGFPNKYTATLVQNSVIAPIVASAHGRAFTISEEDYDGVIWCPSLSRNHTWLARRRGSVYFTGNTDVVKMILAWGGFFWTRTVNPALNSHTQSDGSQDVIAPMTDDPIFPQGRIWGDCESTGAPGKSDLPVDFFDKKPLSDIITQVREVVNYIFFIDEFGGAVWRSPNIWQVGNYMSGVDGGPNTGRTTSIVEISDNETLLSLSMKFSSRNVRERVVVGNSAGSVAGVAKGMFGATCGPFESGQRRVAVYSDSNFATANECEIMADLITGRQMFEWRTDTFTVPGYPAIQIDDQVRIFERTTSESYLHYVKGIESEIDLGDGKWVYNLATHWLGEQPFQNWVFDPAKLGPETQAYLKALGKM
jgi:hypothetical protein